MHASTFTSRVVFVYLAESGDQFSSSLNSGYMTAAFLCIDESIVLRNGNFLNRGALKLDTCFLQKFSKRVLPVRLHNL